MGLVMYVQNADRWLMNVMERKASEFAPKDVISGMPDNVVTNILNRLPIQDAVRTGILSRNWRFKWTLLSELVFDINFFYYLANTEYGNDYGGIISRMLLLLKGYVTKCVLFIDDELYSGFDVEDFNHWILFLSKNGIKDLTIWKWTDPPLMLPSHFFSCLELEHLKLLHCWFDPPASFYGFPNLLSLELDLVPSVCSGLGKYVTRRPLLEVLKIRLPLIQVLGMNNPSKCRVKLSEIAKLTNLKMLSLSLFHIDNMKITNSNSIFKLVGFLPKLEELHLDFINCKFTESVAKRRSPTAFPCLKALKLSRIDFGEDIMLSCVLELIKGFPNLQTLKITAIECGNTLTPTICAKVDYNTTGVLQLRSVLFTYLKGSENEVSLIQYLLACSPFLKKMVIRPHRYKASLVSDKRSKFARKLLRLHRASPVVDIDLH